MKLIPYSAYKNSEVKWLGMIPKSWGIIQSRRLFGLRKDKAIEAEQQLTASQRYGVIYQSDYMAIEGQKVVQVITGAEILKHVEPNDFVISMRSFQGGIEWCGLRGSISSAYVMLIPCKNVVPDFYKYLFKSTSYIQALQSTSNLVRDGQALRYDNFTQVDLPLLSNEDQLLIASFLDRETGKLDTLITKQQHLIELLQEKRQAIISQTVTKGLNPDAEMKDSGVEWLGLVPSNWVSWKVSKAFGFIGSGTTPTSAESEWYEGGHIPWVTTGELRENVIYETTKSVTLAALKKFSALRIHRSGSLAIAMYGATIGRLGILGVDATTNQACCVLSSPKHLNIKFTYYWLMGFKQAIIDLYATGGGQPNINQETIASLRIPAPSMGEQLEISIYLDKQVARIDDLVEKAKRSIELAKEHRAALISAAVTGKIDVREAA